MRRKPRRWNRWAPVLGAALAAALLTSWMRGDPSGGNALAAAPALRNLGSGLVAITTGGNDTYGNRLVLVDTGPKKQILVYRLRAGNMRLVAVRGYANDLEWGLTPDARGLGFSPETAARKAAEARDARKLAGIPWQLQGEEMVLSCDSDESEGRNRIVLVNPVLKTVLVYRLNGNSLWLEAARPFDYDQMLLYTDREVSLTHQEVVDMVREAERRAAAGLLPAGR